MIEPAMQLSQGIEKDLERFFSTETVDLCRIVGAMVDVEKRRPGVPQPSDPTPEPPSKEPEDLMPQKHARVGDIWHSGFHGSDKSAQKRMQEISAKIDRKGYRQVATLWIPVAKGDALKIVLYKAPDGETFMVGVLHQRRGQGRWNSYYLFGHKMPDEFVPQGFVEAAPRFAEHWEAKKHVMRLPGRR